MTNRGVQLTIDSRRLAIGDARQYPNEKRISGDLITLRDIARLQSDVQVMTLIAAWIDQYLIRAHPQLGRTGPVCPFARGAQMRDSIRIAVARFGVSPECADIVSVVRVHKQEFFRLRETMKAEDRIYTSLMIAFPDVPRERWPELIDGTKEILKPEFVRSGLMLGEFHADNEQPGLHSAEFRPLRSPVPMLVMRHMAPSDIAFLSRPEDSPGARTEFLTAYLASQPTLTQAERTRAEELLQTACVESASGQAND